MMTIEIENKAEIVHVLKEKYLKQLQSENEHGATPLPTLMFGENFIDPLLIPTFCKYRAMPLGTLSALFRNQSLRKVLLFGGTGSGKTTLCKKVAYDWAQDRLCRDEIIFFIPLKELNLTASSDPEKIIYSYLFGDSDEKSRISFESFQEMIANSSRQCLWILDGYDQIAEPLEKNAIIKKSWLDFLKKISLSTGRVFLTSQNKEDLPLDSDLFDCVVQNCGFSSSNIKSFIYRFVRSSQDAEKLWEFLCANQMIDEYATIDFHFPENLNLICQAFERNQLDLAKANDSTVDVGGSRSAVTFLCQQLAAYLEKRKEPPTLSSAKTPTESVSGGAILEVLVAVDQKPKQSSLPVLESRATLDNQEENIFDELQRQKCENAAQYAHMAVELRETQQKLERLIKEPLADRVQAELQARLKAESEEQDALKRAVTKARKDFTIELLSRGLVLTGCSASALDDSPVSTLTESPPSALLDSLFICLMQSVNGYQICDLDEGDYFLGEREKERIKKLRDKCVNLWAKTHADSSITEALLSRGSIYNTIVELINEEYKDSGIAITQLKFFDENEIQSQSEILICYTGMAEKQHKFKLMLIENNFYAVMPDDEMVTRNTEAHRARLMIQLTSSQEMIFALFATVLSHSLGGRDISQCSSLELNNCCISLHKRLSEISDFKKFNQELLMKLLGGNDPQLQNSITLNIFENFNQELFDSLLSQALTFHDQGDQKLLTQARAAIYCLCKMASLPVRESIMGKKSDEIFELVKKTFLQGLYGLVSQEIRRRVEGADLPDSDESLKALQSKKASLENECDAIQLKLKKKDEEIQEEKNDLEKRLKQEEELKHQYDRQRSEIEKPLADLTEEIKRLQQEIEHLKHIDKKSGEELAAKEQELSEKKGREKLFQAQQLKIEKELKENESHLTELTKELNGINSELNEVIIRKGYAEASLKETENELKCLTDWRKFLEAIHRNLLQHKDLFKKRHDILSALEGPRKEGHLIGYYQVLSEKLLDVPGFKLEDKQIIEAGQACIEEGARLKCCGSWLPNLYDVLEDVLGDPKIDMDDPSEFKCLVHANNVSWTELFSIIHSKIEEKMAYIGLKFEGDQLTVENHLALIGFTDLPENRHKGYGRLRQLIWDKIRITYPKSLSMSGDEDDDHCVCFDRKNFRFGDTIEVLKNLKIDFLDVLKCFVDHIEITVGHHLYLDAPAIKLPGISVSCYAGECIECHTNLTIDTSGKPPVEFVNTKAHDGKAYRDILSSGQPNGQPGDDGANGHAGMSAGHITLRSRKKIVGLETLTCKANGADGMKGKDPGDGDQGHRGQDTPPAQADKPLEFGRSQGHVMMSRISGKEGHRKSDPVTRRGEVSGPGGQGGKGSLGGAGGISGDIVIEYHDQEDHLHFYKLITTCVDKKIVQEQSPEKAEVQFTAEAKSGSQGQSGKANGTGGEPGEGGRAGCCDKYNKRHFLAPDEHESGYFPEDIVDNPGRYWHNEDVNFFSVLGFGLFFAPIMIEEQERVRRNRPSLQYSEQVKIYGGYFNIGSSKCAPMGAQYKREAGEKTHRGTKDESTRKQTQRLENTANRSENRSQTQRVAKAIADGHAWLKIVPKYDARITELEKRKTQFEDKIKAFEETQQAAEKRLNGVKEQVDAAQAQVKELKESLDRVTLMLKVQREDINDEERALLQGMSQSFQIKEQIIKMQAKLDYGQIDVAGIKELRDNLKQLYGQLSQAMEVRRQELELAIGRDKTQREKIASELEDVQKQLARTSHEHDLSLEKQRKQQLEILRKLTEEIDRHTQEKEKEQVQLQLAIELPSELLQKRQNENRTTNDLASPPEDLLAKKRQNLQKQMRELFVRGEASEDSVEECSADLTEVLSNIKTALENGSALPDRNQWETCLENFSYLLQHRYFGIDELSRLSSIYSDLQWIASDLENKVQSDVEPYLMPLKVLGIILNEHYIRVILDELRADDKTKDTVKQVIQRSELTRLESSEGHKDKKLSTAKQMARSRCFYAFYAERFHAIKTSGDGTQNDAKLMDMGHPASPLSKLCMILDRTALCYETTEVAKRNDEANEALKRIADILEITEDEYNSNLSEEALYELFMFALTERNLAFQQGSFEEQEALLKEIIQRTNSSQGILNTLHQWALQQYQILSFERIQKKFVEESHAINALKAAEVSLSILFDFLSENSKQEAQAHKKQAISEALFNLLKLKISETRGWNVFLAAGVNQEAYLKSHPDLVDNIFEWAVKRVFTQEDLSNLSEMFTTCLKIFGEKDVESTDIPNANGFSGLAQIDSSPLGIPLGGEERATGVYKDIQEGCERQCQQRGKQKCEEYKLTEIGLGVFIRLINERKTQLVKSFGQTDRLKINELCSKIDTLLRLWTSPYCEIPLNERCLALQALLVRTEVYKRNSENQETQERNALADILKAVQEQQGEQCNQQFQHVMVNLQESKSGAVQDGASKPIDTSDPEKSLDAVFTESIEIVNKMIDPKNLENKSDLLKHLNSYWFAIYTVFEQQPEIFTPERLQQFELKIIELRSRMLTIGKETKIDKQLWVWLFDNFDRLSLYVLQVNQKRLTDVFRVREQERLEANKKLGDKRNKIIQTFANTLEKNKVKDPYYKQLRLQFIELLLRKIDGYNALHRDSESPRQFQATEDQTTDEIESGLVKLTNQCAFAYLVKKKLFILSESSDLNAGLSKELNGYIQNLVKELKKTPQEIESSKICDAWMNAMEKVCASCFTTDSKKNQWPGEWFAQFCLDSCDLLEHLLFDFSDGIEASQYQRRLNHIGQVLLYVRFSFEQNEVLSGETENKKRLSLLSQLTQLIRYANCQADTYICASESLQDFVKKNGEDAAEGTWRKAQNEMLTTIYPLLADIQMNANPVLTTTLVTDELMKGLEQKTAEPEEALREIKQTCQRVQKQLCGYNAGDGAEPLQHINELMNDLEASKTDEVLFTQSIKRLYFTLTSAVNRGSLQWVQLSELSKRFVKLYKSHKAKLNGDSKLFLVKLLDDMCAQFRKLIMRGCVSDREKYLELMQHIDAICIASNNYELKLCSYFSIGRKMMVSQEPMSFADFMQNASSIAEEILKEMECDVSEECFEIEFEKMYEKTSAADTADKWVTEQFSMMAKFLVVFPLVGAKGYSNKRTLENLGKLSNQTSLDKQGMSIYLAKIFLHRLSYFILPEKFVGLLKSDSADTQILSRIMRDVEQRVLTGAYLLAGTDSSSDEINTNWKDLQETIALLSSLEPTTSEALDTQHSQLLSAVLKLGLNSIQAESLGASAAEVSASESSPDISTKSKSELMCEACEVKWISRLFSENELMLFNHLYNLVKPKTKELLVKCWEYLASDPAKCEEKMQLEYVDVLNQMMMEPFIHSIRQNAKEIFTSKDHQDDERLFSHYTELWSRGDLKQMKHYCQRAYDLLMQINPNAAEKCKEVRKQLLEAVTYKKLFLRVNKFAYASGQQAVWLECVGELTKLPRKSKDDIACINHILSCVISFSDLSKVHALLKDHNLQKKPDALALARFCLEQKIGSQLLRHSDGPDSAVLELEKEWGLLQLVVKNSGSEGVVFLHVFANFLERYHKEFSENIDTENAREILRLVLESKVYRKPSAISSLRNTSSLYKWKRTLLRTKMMEQLSVFDVKDEIEIKTLDEIISQLIRLHINNPIMVQKFIDGFEHASITHPSILSLNDFKKIVDNFTLSKWILEEKALQCLMESTEEEKSKPEWKSTTEWCKELDAYYKKRETNTEPLTVEQIVDEMQKTMGGAGINAGVSKLITRDPITKKSPLEHELEEIDHVFSGASGKGVVINGITVPACHLEKEQILAWIAQLKSLKEALSKEGKSTASIFLDEKMRFELVAVILKAANDALKKDPRNTQKVALLCFINSLNDSKAAGRLAEIATGEGKSLIVAMCAVVLALQQDKSVDVITSNPELAERDAEEYKPFFDCFGITVGNNCDKKCADDDDERQRRYEKNRVVYGETASFQRDFLLTQFFDKPIRTQPAGCVIVDEVDSMLIDNAEKTLYISHGILDLRYLKELFIAIWAAVNSAPDVQVESDANIENIKKMLLDQIERKIIIVPDSLTKFVERRLPILIKNAYLAKQIKPNNDYVVVDDNTATPVVTVVDKPTGVEQRHTHWNNGLHQFVQLQNCEKFVEESLKAIFISNLVFFKENYHGALYGMTGTIGAEKERDLLKANYNIDFFKLPRFREQRHIHEAGTVCQNPEAWLSMIVEKIKYKTFPTLESGEVMQSLEQENQDCLKKLNEKLKELKDNSIDPDVAKKNLEALMNEADELRKKLEDCEKLLAGDLSLDDSEIIVDSDHKGPDCYFMEFKPSLEDWRAREHAYVIAENQLFYCSKFRIEKIEASESEVKDLIYKLVFDERDTDKGPKKGLTQDQLQAVKLLRERSVRAARGSERKSIADKLKILEKKIKTDREVFEATEKQMKAYEDDIKDLTDKFDDKSRPILIICETIQSVDDIESRLRKEQEKQKDKTTSDTFLIGKEIRTYKSTLGEKFNFRTLRTNDIVIATNLAGRGSDFDISALADRNGGLHVILSYMPANGRVEAQALNRTARQGKKGSSEIVVCDSRKDVTIEFLQDERDADEVRRLERIERYGILSIETEHELFVRFTGLRNHIRQKLILREEDGVQLRRPDADLQIESLHNAWAFFLDEKEEFIKKLGKAKDKAKAKQEIFDQYEAFSIQMKTQLNTETYGLIREPAELIKLGRMYLDSKNFSMAEQVYDAVINKFPNIAGFAYYYKCYCLIAGDDKEIGTKIRARKALKKSVELFRSSLERLQADIQAMRIVNQKQRKSGEGLKPNYFERGILGEMECLQVHLNAAEKLLGGELKAEDFRSADVTGNEPFEIFSALANDGYALAKPRRIRKKIKMKGTKISDGTGAEIKFPTQFSFCEEQTVEILAKAMKTEGRKITPDAFTELMPTRSKLKEILKDRIMEQEFIALNSELPKDATLGRWDDAVFLGCGDAIKAFVLALSQSMSLDEFTKDLMAAVKEKHPEKDFTKEQMESIYDHLKTKKIIAMSFQFYLAPPSLLDTFFKTITLKTGVDIGQACADFGLKKIPCLQPHEKEIFDVLQDPANKNRALSPSDFKFLDEQMFKILVLILNSHGLLEKDLLGHLELNPAVHQRVWVEMCLIKLSEAKEKGCDQKSLEIDDDARGKNNELWMHLKELKIVKDPETIFPMTKDRGDIEKRIEEIKEIISAKIRNLVLSQFPEDKHKEDVQKPIGELGAVMFAPRTTADIELEKKKARYVESICETLKTLSGQLKTFAKLKIDEDKINLFSFFEKSKLPPEITEYMQQCCDLVLSAKESRGLFDLGAFAVFLMGLAQIVVGVVFSVIPGAQLLGEMLIQEGIGDVVFAVQSSIEGNFSWKAYGDHKLISMVATLATFGVGSVLSKGKEAIDKSVSVLNRTLSALKKAALNLVKTLVVNMGVSLITDQLMKIAVDIIMREINTGLSKWIETSGAYQEATERLRVAYKELYDTFGKSEADNITNALFTDQAIRDKFSQLSVSLNDGVKNLAQNFSSKLSTVQAHLKDNCGGESIQAILDITQVLEKVIYCGAIAQNILEVAKTSSNVLSLLGDDLRNAMARKLQEKAKRDEAVINAENASQNFEDSFKKLCDEYKSTLQHELEGLVRNTLFDKGLARHYISQGVKFLQDQAGTAWEKGIEEFGAMFEEKGKQQQDEFAIAAAYGDEAKYSTEPEGSLACVEDPDYEDGEVSDDDNEAPNQQADDAFSDDTFGQSLPLMPDVSSLDSYSLWGSLSDNLLESTYGHLFAADGPLAGAEIEEIDRKEGAEKSEHVAVSSQGESFQEFRNPYLQMGFSILSKMTDVLFPSAFADSGEATMRPQGGENTPDLGLEMEPTLTPEELGRRHLTSLDSSRIEGMKKFGLFSPAAERCEQHDHLQDHGEHSGIEVAKEKALVKTAEHFVEAGMKGRARNKVFDEMGRKLGYYKGKVMNSRRRKDAELIIRKYMKKAKVVVESAEKKFHFGHGVFRGFEATRTVIGNPNVEGVKMATEDFARDVAFAAASGFTAGLICGPAAPVCVPVCIIALQVMLHSTVPRLISGEENLLLGPSRSESLNEGPTLRPGTRDRSQGPEKDLLRPMAFP